MQRKLFLLGGTGFVGKEVLQEAVKAGWQVKALVRSAEKGKALEARGAIPVVGSAENPEVWMGEVKNSDLLIDLVQPALPARIGLKEMKIISEQRQGITQKILESFQKLSVAERPLWVSVSGADDLEPDTQGNVRDNAPLRSKPQGFSAIGIPLRRMIENSSVSAVFLYLGTVYGPGKSFAESLLPRLSQGKLKLSNGGNNRIPLVNVKDAARAIVHLAGLEVNRLKGKSFLIVDESGGTKLSDLFHWTAAQMGVKAPGSIPAWIFRLVVGQSLFETITRDLPAFPTALKASGFQFTYPTYREGMPPTLKALGYDQKPQPVPAALTNANTALVQSNRAPQLVASAQTPKVDGLFWTLLIATVAALVTLNTVDFSLSVPGLKSLAGGLPILDTRFFYSPADVYRLFDAFGPIGRQAYLTEIWTLDVGVPLLFSFFLWALLGRGTFRKFRFVAFAAGGMDYLENILISCLLTHYPAHLDSLVWTAACATLTKQMLYYGFLVWGLTGLALKPKVYNRVATPIFNTL